MPLEIVVDVVPHGIENRRHTLHRVRVTQIAAYDSLPGGRRRYLVEVDGDTRRTVEVEHDRADGALRLVQRAFRQLDIEGVTL